MSACDTCCSPGACCRLFTLSFRVPITNWKAEAERRLREVNCEFFRPVRPAEHWLDEAGTTQVFFSCDRLTPEGRCGDYENRPKTCSSFEPLSDSLCIMMKPALKGIPIRVAA